MSSKGPLVDLTGQRINSLTVLRAIRRQTKWGNVWEWECQCDCGATTIKTTSKLQRGEAVSCGCTHRVRRNRHHKWKGCGKLSGDLFGRYKRNAIDRDIEFDITVEYAWKVFVEQDGLCALTGEPLTFPQHYKDRRSYNYTASLDRIDSSKGYIIGNIQWVHKDINRLKWDLTQDKLLELCEKIVKWKNR